MWFDKKFPLATYIDIRPEVEPDIVMDCTHTAFPDSTFDLILFDPPHQNLGESTILLHKFGHFTHAQIRDLVKRGFKEFHRILKSEGFVVFKWNTHSFVLGKILSLATPYFTPLFGQREDTKPEHGSRTYWILLIKRR